MTTQILLVEDDPILGRGLSVNLELESYKVHWVKDLSSAKNANLEEKLNLVILDLGLPDGSGLSLLKEIRESGSRLPVLILTAQTDEDSVVEGLELGASDYMKKPFSNKELLARIKNILREPRKRGEQIRYEGILVLVENRKIIYNEIEIELNRREFDTLFYLIQNADNIVTRESLISWYGNDSEIFDRTIDSHISHLRSKLKKAGVNTVKISSVYGLGYRLEKR